jgi:transglutaminase-like putative cysteine protease
MSLATIPARLQAMLVRLTGTMADSTGWARSGLSGGSQQLVRDTLRLAFEPEVPDSTGSDEPDDALVPSRDRAIVALATRVRGDESDPRRVADRLLAWVSAEIAPGGEPGAPSARRALRTRRGDASDRALLFVALARASGLAARPVAGIVAQEPGWARHAWAEVKLADWVPVDPTFGTFPAGAGYVRLLAGAPGDPLHVVPLAASLAPDRLTRQKTR